MHVMIRACQDIDERYQERQMEKRGFQTRTGWTKPKNQAAPKAQWPQPMDLDLIQGRYPKKEARKQAKPKKQGKKQQDKKKTKCFNCQKEGHWARECRQPKKEVAEVHLLDLVPDDTSSNDAEDDLGNESASDYQQSWRDDMLAALQDAALENSNVEDQSQDNELDEVSEPDNIT